MANNVTRFTRLHRAPPPVPPEQVAMSSQPDPMQWWGPSQPGWDQGPCPPPPCPPCSPQAWPPIWPPPQNWCPPPCPPPQPPSCFSGVSKANQCWDNSQALYDLVTQVVEDIFAKNPGIIPPPNPTAGSGPILGVTNGSTAAPGEVGELLQTVVQIPYAAYPTITEPIISTLVVPPGDWDLWCAMRFAGGAPGAIGGASFGLNPEPPGITSDMGGLIIFGTTVGQAEEGATIIGTQACLSTATPQLLAFQVVINQSTDSTLPAGTAGFQVIGRRRR
jgi:hypothetical protein